jgi:hypothetical protein
MSKKRMISNIVRFAAKYVLPIVLRKLRKRKKY